MSAPDSRPPDEWGRETLTRLLESSIVEQRRARRWGIFFKLLVMAYLIALLAMVNWPLPWVWDKVSGDPHVAVVRITGLIAEDRPAAAGTIASGLRAAFEDPGTRAVMLVINSPGGSPVQSGQVYDTIRTLREKYPQTPVYAVAQDVCASGAYYVASAADRIYADKASVVGSIGVVAGSFGFADAIRRLGIERRLYVAGDDKGMLDPFLPEDPEHVRHLESLLVQIHDQFVEAVKSGRGTRLAEDPRLFSGLVWTGAEALQLGLVDGLGSPRQVAEREFQTDRLVDFTPRRRLLDRLLESLGMAMVRAWDGGGFGPRLVWPAPG